MGASIAQLQERLVALEDREAILALKARYWRSMDLGLVDDVAACLSENVAIDFEGMPPTQDRESFIAIVRATAGKAGAFHVHHGHNPEVALVDADRATGRWEIFYSGIDLPHRLVMQMSGVYEDRYVKTDDRWLIQAMTMRQTSFSSRTVDADGHVNVSLPGAAGLTIEV